MPIAFRRASTAANQRTAETGDPTVAATPSRAEAPAWRSTWSQNSLSASSKSAASYRRIEQSDFEPRLATARKLAGALGVRVEWVVFGLGPATEQEEQRYGNHAGHDGR